MDHELERVREANAHLDRYASLVAHDIQAPARRIMSFAHLLRDEVKGQDGPALEYVDYILQAASQLANQTAALLEFSRGMPDPGELEPVELSAVLGEVLADLSEEVASRDAEVEVGPLNWVLGTRALLYSVLRQVVTNALRHHGRQAPHVRISSSPAVSATGVSCVRLLIRDHGPGIMEQDRERAFEPLQRLHSPPSTSTGMGLAIARRAVAALDGWISLSAPEDGPGTMVTVDLPHPH